MGRTICHYKGMFFEWSSVVDAPVTSAENLEGFTAYYRDNYGQERVRSLPDRLERAVAKGVSSFDEESLETLILGNRAGEDERPATLRQILAMVGIDDPEADDVLPREVETDLGGGYTLTEYVSRAAKE